MNALVVYYSLTGNTDAFARGIAQTLTADKIRLKDERTRAGMRGFITAFLDVFFRRSNLPKANYDLTNYDLIFIGTPVWFSRPTPAVDAFIATANLKNKRVVLFITMRKSGGKKTASILENRIKSKGGEVVNTFIADARSKRNGFFECGVEVGKLFKNYKKTV